jgi:ATP-dependent RNA helicase DeaD
MDGGLSHRVAFATMSVVAHRKGGGYRHNEMSVSTSEVMPLGLSERPQEYVADVSFEDLGLSSELRRAIAERGYTHPTPVQAKAFEPARRGKDLIVRSKTGTGKTAAFGLPVIEQIPVGTREVRALILCPTRELALQVTHELVALAKYRDIAVISIYGGASMKQQEDALKAGAAVVVGTPGRVFDHIRRGNLKLETCKHAVLDEADEMLNQGFYEEVTRILDHLPKERQVLLFSATVPEDIRRLIARHTHEPETLLLSGDVYTVEHIHHVRYELSDAYPKPRNLLYMLELENPDNAIIFCNTRDDTELVTAVLNRNGFDAELLNGDLPQKERERVMGRIKRGEVAFMVATDLAARGIDISDLGHVINYSLPEDPAVYLHRVGRTGRIGKKGVALNITSGRELATLTTLEKKYGIAFESRPMPTPEAANALFMERHVREVKEAALGAIYEGYLQLATSLRARTDADDLIAFLLKSFFTHRRMEKAQHSHADEADAPSRDQSGKKAGPKGARGDREGGRRSGREREQRDRPPRDRQPRDSQQALDRDRTSRSEKTKGSPVARAESNDQPKEKALDLEAPPPSHEGRSRGLDRFGRSGVSEPGSEPLGVHPTPPFGRSSIEPNPSSDRSAMMPFHAEAPPNDTGARPSPRARGRRDRPSSETHRVSPTSEMDTAGERPRLSDREAFEQYLAQQRSEPSATQTVSPSMAPRERSGAPPARLSDRELFERLQRGEPLPPIDDPTSTTDDSAQSSPGHEQSRRNERSDRRRRSSTITAPIEAGHARLWVNLGKFDGVDETSLPAALEALGAPAGKVTRAELRGSYSYVHVADTDVPVFEALGGKLHNGEKALKVERAREKS